MASRDCRGKEYLPIDHFSGGIEVELHPAIPMQTTNSLFSLAVLAPMLLLLRLHIDIFQQTGVSVAFVEVLV